MPRGIIYGGEKKIVVKGRGRGDSGWEFQGVPPSLEVEVIHYRSFAGNFGAIHYIISIFFNEVKLSLRKKVN